MNNSFRYDINGLRAYAILLVVLYHFGIPGFSGGFIGVDIFFVISGFLMTKNILDQIENNKFSLIKFYLARGIRIIPALLFLTFFISIIGWLLLIPEEYKTYAKHALSSINFISNIVYLRESGNYFATDTHNNILLHTWSLSVEWQFYIILPILLLIFSKIPNFKNKYGTIIILTTIISLIASYILSNKNQTFSFYMILTRAWEMLAGGIIYLYFSKINLSKFNKYSLETIGFSFILMSLILFNPTSLWPSINALIPILGTMFIIIANNQNSLFTKIRFLQFLGNSSYSIYLWHWPIVFFVSYLSIHNDLVTCIAIILSVLLGWLSYYFIETPTRKKLSKLSLVSSYLILIIAIVSLSLLYIYIYKKDGFPNRATEKYFEKTALISYPSPETGWCFYSVDNLNYLPVGKQGLQCHIGSNKNSAKSALLFGDSYAGHNIPFWDSVGKQVDLNINAISTNWCYPSLGENFTGPKSSRAYEQCLINRKFLKENIGKYDVIILAGRWGAVYEDSKRVDELKNLISTIKNSNVPLIIMDSPYYFGQNIGNSYKRSVWLNNKFMLPVINESDKEASRANHDLQIFSKKFDHTLYLLREDLYRKENTDNNIPYSFDGGHISVYGSLASAKFFLHTSKFMDLKRMVHESN